MILQIHHNKCTSKAIKKKYMYCKFVTLMCAAIFQFTVAPQSPIVQQANLNFIIYIAVAVAFLIIVIIVVFCLVRRNQGGVYSGETDTLIKVADIQHLFLLKLHVW